MDFNGKKIRNKWLDETEIEYLLSLRPSDITRDLMNDLFAITLGQTAPQFLANDVFVLKKKDTRWMGCTHNLSDETRTSVGRYFFNLWVTENYEGHVDYWNDNMNGDEFHAYQESMGDVIMSKKVEIIPHYEGYCNNLVFLNNLAEYMIPADTYEMLLATPALKRKLAELKIKYAEGLKNDPAITGAKIEREVLAFARTEYSHLETSKIYDVGDPSFGNDFKNMSVMNGPQFNQDTGEWEVSFSNFADGIKKSELSTFADVATTSGFLRSVGTGKGGDFTKQLCAALAHMQLDTDGEGISDCGTKECITVHLDNYNERIYKYRYILEGGELIELMPEIMKNYIGKTVQMRSINTCTREDSNICQVCAGGSEIRKGITNIGLTAPSITSAILRILLKAMHDSTTKLTTVIPHLYATRVR